MRVLWYLACMAPGMAAALAIFVCLIPWRKRRLTARGLVSGGPRELGILLLFFFSGGMAVLTLCPSPDWLWAGLQGYWTPYFGGPGIPLAHRVNLLPFSQGDSLFNIAGNIVMFVPFGFLAALLWRGWSWRRTLGLGLCLTGFVECWQLRVGRAFDIDDLMLNTFGTLCGFWLWRALRALAPDFTERFHVHGDKETYE